MLSYLTNIFHIGQKESPIKFLTFINILLCPAYSNFIFLLSFQLDYSSQNSSVKFYSLEVVFRSF